MSAEDATRDVTYHRDVELQEFFKRPIVLTNYRWTPGGTWANVTFNPWTLYLSNPRVANRMSNYQNFSGKMCLKILINGNSFYYGRLMMYYVPLGVGDVGAAISVGKPAKIMNSQRLKLFIDPTQSQAGEMCLPFMWYFDKLRLTSTDHTRMGDIYIMALNELKHANGATTPISITVYGWMEDVKLSTPTASNAAFITTQGGKLDEYGTGPVSAVGTAVAKMAGNLRNAPVIGKYARATEVAAGAGAAIAKMFGMSRPCDISPPILMQPRSVSGFAVTDVADPSVKLTVDSKQELSIDSGVTGVDCGDEMALRYIATRESYIETFNWTTAYVQNTILFAARVMPQAFYRAGTPAYTTVPACTYVATAFQYWRGTVRYRFQVVASDYHKGRLLFVWDPTSGKTTPESNVQYTKVVDIAQERDFVLDVAWGNHATWMETTGLNTNYTLINAGTYAAGYNVFANGVLTVYVLNELTTPNSAINNDIQVNVYLSMCDDAEFAVPLNRFQRYSAWGGSGTTPQGGEMEIEDENAPVAEGNTEEYTPCLKPADATNLVYMGESISSFRQLIKRYNLLWTSGVIAGIAGYWSWSTQDFPLSRGYESGGLRAGTTLAYNPVHNTLMRYLAFAFVNYRGGVRNKFVYTSTNAATPNSMMAVRRNEALTISPPTVTPITTATVEAMEDQAMSFSTVGSEGMHAAPTSANPVLEVEFPFYRNARFVSLRGGYSAMGSSYPTAEQLTHTYTIHNLNSQTSMYYVYVAGAEDSNFSCFQGCLPFQLTPTFS